MRKATIAALFILLAIATDATKSSPSAAVDGTAIFKKKCARCHGKEGIKDSRTPNLQTIDRTKEGLIKSTTNGKITEGKKERMPAWKNKLSDEQISAVADLILSWHKK
jgi:mono/diheme cytochrome c family protein